LPLCLQSGILSGAPLSVTLGTMKALLAIVTSGYLQAAIDAQAATNAQSAAVWKPQPLANGLYEPDPRHRSFAGELIGIQGTNFHYTRFTDVLGVPTPNYTGTIVQVKDHVLFNHPKVPNPERISGVLCNRPVLWEWESYDLWKRLGVDPKPHELLYLVPAKAEPGGAANRSQPAGPGTNRASPAAGSGG